ncbi:MAG: hypothetical protein K2X27_02230 [Candidatus Obscuribacterales bacterium]|nr:hypothetical protein [Candidatus Obscuribacterales bacterium]
MKEKNCITVFALVSLCALFNLNACLAASSDEGSDSKATDYLQAKGYLSIKDALATTISQTGEHSYKIEAGSRFLVVCDNGLSSSTAKVGDLVSVKLANDIYFDGHVILPKSTELQGVVSQVEQGRSGLSADLPGKHWMNAQGVLGLQFKQAEIGEKRISLEANPVPMSLVAGATPGRLSTVTDKQGDFTLYYHSGRYACINAGIAGSSVATGAAGSALAQRVGSYALSRVGFFVPAIMSGMAGAASPSYALGHPDEQVGLRERGKGFMLGFAKGLPGGGILMSAVQQGTDVSLAPGDEFVVELKSAADITE